MSLGDLFVGHGEAILRLAAALVSGSVLGLDRELRDKPAGLRTHAVVALGAAIATITALEFARRGDGTLNSDAVSRVIQGMLTGIGFVGAGAIIRDAQGESVRGLTTAASVWVSTCLGIACGFGYWYIVLAGLGLTLLILIVGGRFERWVKRRAGWMEKSGYVHRRSGDPQ